VLGPPQTEKVGEGGSREREKDRKRPASDMETHEGTIKKKKL
jgi:hypothetical protein